MTADTYVVMVADLNEMENCPDYAVCRLAESFATREAAEDRADELNTRFGYQDHYYVVTLAEAVAIGA
jgi:hypothetical protein